MSRVSSTTRSPLGRERWENPWAAAVKADGYQRECVRRSTDVSSSGRYLWVPQIDRDLGTSSMPALCGIADLDEQRCHGMTGEGIQRAVSEGGSFMVNQRSALNVTSRYENFLFAPICDEPGGMRLSVLSALARMNVDPWEEAARLATLSTSDAQRTLVSTLNLLADNRQTPADTEMLAARLIALQSQCRSYRRTRPRRRPARQIQGPHRTPRPQQKTATCSSRLLLSTVERTKATQPSRPQD
jgi:hypothetical protein